MPVNNARGRPARRKVNWKKHPPTPPSPLSTPRAACFAYLNLYECPFAILTRRLVVKTEIRSLFSRNDNIRSGRRRRRRKRPQLYELLPLNVYPRPYTHPGELFFADSLTDWASPGSSRRRPPAPVVLSFGDGGGGGRTLFFCLLDPLPPPDLSYILT